VIRYVLSKKRDTKEGKAENSVLDMQWKNDKN